MLYNEWVELGGKPDQATYKIAEAVYGSLEATPVAGHVGHESARKWVQKNKAEVASIAGLVEVLTQDAKYAKESGLAMHRELSAQVANLKRQNELLETRLQQEREHNDELNRQLSREIAVSTKAKNALSVLSRLRSTLSNIARDAGELYLDVEEVENSVEEVLA